MTAATGAAGIAERFRALPATALAVLPVSLRLIAEGSWIAVVYALLEAASTQPLPLNPLAFALAGAVGALAARYGTRRLGDRWPAVAIVLVAMLGALGWLSAASARDALTSQGLGAALSHHAGGWLLGLGLLRGIADSRAAGDKAPAGSLVAIGVPAIFASFVLGSALADPAGSAFRASALGDTILFAATGMVSLALTRIGRLGPRSGLDWRRNPAWLGLLLALVAAILLVAVPASFAVGPVVMLVLAMLPLPLFVAGFFVGIDRRGMRLLVVTIAVVGGAVLLARLLLPVRDVISRSQAAGVGQQTQTDQSWVLVAGWLILVVGMAALIGLLAAIWMRQTLAARDDEVGEERTIDRGIDTERGRGRRFSFRHRGIPTPHDAAEAYLAALATLERNAGLRRQPGETPAEHARRIRMEVVEPAPDGTTRRRDAVIGGPLTRLAADYELARFGGRNLSPAENRRALARWEWIRSSVRSAHLPSADSDAGSARADGAGEVGD